MKESQVFMQASSSEKPLYQKHIPIVTRSVKGKFRNFKTLVLLLAYSVFFALPWLPWARQSGAPQAILFDLDSRRYFIFDLIVYPQDVFWLAMLLFIAAAFLFFITGLIGRAWCGYFCFQTLWSDLFIFIEHCLQGERPARLKLQQQAWGLEKLAKVGGSHVLMLLVSFWTAVTFCSYFAYTPQFVSQVFSLQAPAGGYLAIVVLTATTYLAGGVAREQICMYFCPYARFQGVMYEPDTLAVSYDARRGEGQAGRMAPKPGLKTHSERQAAGHGDCIDCGFCVQVCPTGIDIRNGLQYQCISCGLCIDACNNIMDSMGYPRGLIRYDSEANLTSPQIQKPHLKWKRLKVLGYAVALSLMVALLVYNIANRSDHQVTVEQVRQPLYVTLSDGTVRNRYLIHIVNKTEQDLQYQLSVQGIPQQAMDLGHIKQIKIRAGKTLKLNVKVDLPAELAAKTRHFKLIVQPSNGEQAIQEQVSFNSKMPR
jgi:cytochrome c oxidase accessory protein FixG